MLERKISAKKRETPEGLNKGCFAVARYRIEKRRKNIHDNT